MVPLRDYGNSDYERRIWMSGYTILELLIEIESMREEKFKSESYSELF